jgi:hypothetical protein
MSSKYAVQCPISLCTSVSVIERIGKRLALQASPKMAKILKQNFQQLHLMDDPTNKLMCPVDFRPTVRRRNLKQG